MHTIDLRKEQTIENSLEMFSAARKRIEYIKIDSVVLNGRARELLEHVPTSEPDFFYNIMYVHSR